MPEESAEEKMNLIPASALELRDLSKAAKAVAGMVASSRPM